MEAIPQMSWLFSNISSEGNREMTISLEDVKLGVEVSLGLGSWCDDGGVEVTSIRFPLHYKNIEFEFDNIGSVLGAALDIIGDVVVENERLKLVSMVQELILTEVPSLVCKEEKFQSTFLENDLPQYDIKYMNILAKEGSNLVRDRYS